MNEYFNLAARIIFWSMSSSPPSPSHHHFPGHRVISGDPDRPLGTPASLTLPLTLLQIRKQSFSHLFSEIYSQGAKIQVKENRDNQGTSDNLNKQPALSSDKSLVIEKGVRTWDISSHLLLSGQDPEREPLSPFLSRNGYFWLFMVHLWVKIPGGV